MILDDLCNNLLTAFRNHVHLDINDKVSRADVQSQMFGWLRETLPVNHAYDSIIVQCDEENNPPDVIDAKDMICSIELGALFETVKIRLSYQKGYEFRQFIGMREIATCTPSMSITRGSKLMVATKAHEENKTAADYLASDEAEIVPSNGAYSIVVKHGLKMENDHEGT